MLNEAIVLAGGLGIRLRSVVSDVPKPMASIGERPFLEYLLDRSIDQGIQRWAGSPDALNYIETYYTPTAAIRVPVQTVHSNRDPVVPAWHENLYAQRAAEQGTSDLLAQTIVASFGHCAFDDTQVLAAFDQLLARMP